MSFKRSLPLNESPRPTKFIKGLAKYILNGQICNSIVTVVDSVSKRLWAYPVPGATAIEAAKCIKNIATNEFIRNSGRVVS